MAWDHAQALRNKLADLKRSLDVTYNLPEQERLNLPHLATN